MQLLPTSMCSYLILPTQATSITNAVTDVEVDLDGKGKLQAIFRRGAACATPIGGATSCPPDMVDVKFKARLGDDSEGLDGVVTKVRLVNVEGYLSEKKEHEDKEAKKKEKEKKAEKKRREKERKKLRREEAERKEKDKENNKEHRRSKKDKKDKKRKRSMTSSSASSSDDDSISSSDKSSTSLSDSDASDSEIGHKEVFVRIPNVKDQNMKKSASRSPSPIVKPKRSPSPQFPKNASPEAVRPRSPVKLYSSDEDVRDAVKAPKGAKHETEKQKARKLKAEEKAREKAVKEEKKRAEKEIREAAKAQKKAERASAKGKRRA